MTIADARTTRPVHRGRLALFLTMLVMGLIVLYADETFIFHQPATDPEWRHIQPFKWLLLFHAVCAIPALLIGPLQFSERLRLRRPALHRGLGWIYCIAIFLAAPMAFYIGTTYEKPLDHLQQAFQAGGWFLTTLIAFVAAYNRNIVLHKQWMARSYGFSFIFVASRVTDIWPGLIDYSDERTATNALWALTFLALLLPDLLTSGTDLFRSRRPRRRPAA